MARNIPAVAFASRGFLPSARRNFPGIWNAGNLSLNLNPALNTTTFILPPSICRFAKPGSVSTFLSLPSDLPLCLLYSLEGELVCGLAAASTNARRAVARLRKVSPQRCLLFLERISKMHSPSIYRSRWRKKLFNTISHLADVNLSSNVPFAPSAAMSASSVSSGLRLPTGRTMSLPPGRSEVAGPLSK